MDRHRESLGIRGEFALCRERYTGQHQHAEVATEDVHAGKGQRPLCPQALSPTRHKHPNPQARLAGTGGDDLRVTEIIPV